MLIGRRVEHDVRPMQGKDLTHGAHILNVGNYRNEMLLRSIGAQIQAQLEQGVLGTINQDNLTWREVAHLPT